MKKVKIVIGANFGDEGKGLMTDYFADKAKKDHQSCLVICHNGGSQKGHTVVSPSGIRHVFHHFGSGCFAGSNTYLSEEYIVNPIIFVEELQALNEKGLVTKCFIHMNARLTTPFDMMINQIAEEYRSAGKHGSCGLGIFETIVRDNKRLRLTISEFDKRTDTEKAIVLQWIIEEYLPIRIKEMGVKELSEKWKNIFSNRENIIKNYIQDFNNMMEHIFICDDSIIDDYDFLIFEGAQGLLLDQNNVEYMPHLTPSNTGIANPLQIIGNRVCDIEVCYVTRTYMTRHGAGRFDSQCSHSEIAENIVDLTNVPNPYQDSIRYGKLNEKLLFKTIQRDLLNVGKRLNTSLAVTHVDETDHKVITTDGNVNIQNFKEHCNRHFGKIYLSSGLTREQVK